MKTMTTKNTTPSAWRLLKLGALEECGRLGGGTEITTGHYLLALTELRSTNEAGLLHVHCGDTSKLQKSLKRGLVAGGKDSAMSAEQLFNLAKVRAGERRSKKVGLQDILLVLIEAPGLAATVLASFNFTADALKQGLAMKGPK